MMKVVAQYCAKEQINFDVIIMADDTTHLCDASLSAVKCLNTKQLFNNDKTVFIQHLGETYILQLTQQNKLILTQ
jgi:hemin uptake protein HemP